MGGYPYPAWSDVLAWLLLAWLLLVFITAVIGGVSWLTRHPAEANDSAGHRGHLRRTQRRR